MADPILAQWTPRARPAWVRALNAGGRASARVLGREPIALDAASLLEAARRATGGLEDLGEERFGPLREPLERLARSLEAQAALTPVGRWLARWEVRNHLIGRLRVVELLRRHPEIDEQRIEAPVFVTGTGRSGTSILHEVLAQDPRQRALLHWEALFPCPPPEPASHATDPRIRRADREVRRWEAIAPIYRTMHEGGGAVPQEDDFLFNLTLLSDHIPGAYAVRDFARWLAGQDRTPAWRMHQTVLKILQWRMPPRRWVLKAPSHLAHLERLFDTYPDARVIMTHRDPGKVVASMASLRTTLHWLRSDRVDPLAMARSSAEGIGHLLDRATAVRDSGAVPADRFADVHFHAFLRDPIAAVRGAYEKLGLALEEAAAERMRAYLEARPRDRGHGRHRYSLEALGLDPAVLRERFAAYQARYDVPAEALD